MNSILHLLVVIAAPVMGVVSSNILMHLVPGAHLPLLLADINTGAIDGQLKSFLDFMQRLLVLPALGLAVWSFWCFHENKIRDAVLSLVGAFGCAIAVLIVKALFGY